MISIALIEDHPDFRGALQKYLQTQADFICKVAFPPWKIIWPRWMRSILPM